MGIHVNNLIIGQGLAGCAVAWQLHWAGQSLMMVDAGESGTASRVAAGLMTPVTGKRLIRSAEFDNYWWTAKKFYRQVEQQTGRSFFEEQQMIRLFHDEQTRAEFLGRSDQSEENRPWEGRLQKTGRTLPGVTMAPAGRVNVTAYLHASKQYFEERGSFEHADIDVGHLIVEGQIRLISPAITADRMILCTGAQATNLFPDIPNNPSRGEILTVQIPNYERSEIVHRSIWIAPEKDKTQTVGSTYDWSDLSGGTTECGRSEILQKLRRVVEGDAVVLNQVAGVRPTMKDYEPVVGRHPQYGNVFILNGLGSKGTLRAPQLATELLSLIAGGTVPSRHDFQRLRSQPERSPQPLTQRAQQEVATVLQPGDTAIDATVGNGFDTFFLAEAVGKTGQVIGFDVQAQAIEATSKRLAAHELSNVELRLSSHESIKHGVEAESTAAVMFNLGYLPRSDHTVITKKESTVTAITGAMTVLRAGGILTVLSYRGHEGGAEEFAAVERLLSQYTDSYDLRRIDSTPIKENSPVLFVLRKI